MIPGIRTILVAFLPIACEGHGRLTFPMTRVGHTRYENDPVGRSPKGQDFVCRHAEPNSGVTPASVSAGNDMELQWDLSAPHVGDCQVYISYDVDLPLTSQKYVKLANYPECRKLSGQRVRMQLPSILPAGKAILRWDWYALHVNPPEWYAQCADIIVVSSSGQAFSNFNSFKIVDPPIYPESGYRNPYSADGKTLGQANFYMVGPACIDNSVNQCSLTAKGARGYTGFGGEEGAPSTSPSPVPMPSPAPAPVPSPSPLPSPTPTPTPGGSCSGDACFSSSHCRSEWGYCGAGSAYCNSMSTWKASGCGGQPTPTPGPMPTPMPAPMPTPVTTTISTTTSSTIASPTTTMTAGPVVAVQWPAGCGQKRPCAKVRVNGDSASVQISMRGPADAWYGIGFDAVQMSEQPYAIIVLGDGSVQERELGVYAEGEVLDATLLKLQDDVSNGVRTVVLQRAAAGRDSRYHSFISKESINYIWAYGQQATFSYHNFDNGSPARGVWAACLPRAECDPSWCDAEKYFSWCAAQTDQCDDNFCTSGDLAFSLPASTSVAQEFMVVDGGDNRACRGANAQDNSAGYYDLFNEASLEGCKDRCRASQSCVGIEFNSGSGRCEVWVRTEGIGATRQVSGYLCLRYTKMPALAQGLHRRIRTHAVARGSTVGNSWLQQAASLGDVGRDVIEVFDFGLEL